MSFRITTNMMMNSYRYNLMGSTNRLSDARDKVLTQRTFNSYAEDPAAATQAFRLRRDFCQTSSYLSNTKDAYSKYHTAWTALTAVTEELSDKNDRVSAVRGDTGTVGAGRKPLAQVLSESAESIVQTMNGQLGDQFVFAGADGLNVPFTWKGDELYYRGINVNSGGVKPPQATDPNALANAQAAIGGAANWTDDDQAWFDYYTRASSEKPTSNEPTWLGDMVNSNPNVANGSEDKQAWLDYYQHKTDTPPEATKSTTVQGWLDADGNATNLPKKEDPSWSEAEKGWYAYYTDQENYKKLQELCEEEMNVDLGMGLKEGPDGKIIDGSAFNLALSGIRFLGFGVDENGLSNNLAVAAKQLAAIFDRCDSESGEWASGEDEKNAYLLMDKLKYTQEHTTEEWVNLDAMSKFLKTNESRLNDQKNNLNEQILDIEQVDLADALTQFSWDMYCYNSALKIGNQLLSQSLIDYMR